MSQSAIRYRGRVAYIQDGDLREFLKLLAFRLGDAPSELKSSLNWLPAVVDVWMDDHEVLPPGLRDIDLDEALTNFERANSFMHYLEWTMASPFNEGPFDRMRSAVVVKRVLEIGYRDRG